MKTNNFTMRVCLKNKRILLNRATIAMLGNPSHLSFWFDENNGRLIFAPATQDELDSYEIPHYYWRDKNQSCEIARIAFLKALQYSFGWKDGSKYLFLGAFAETGGVPAIIFHMNEGVNLPDT